MHDDENDNYVESLFILEAKAYLATTFLSL